MSARRDSRPVVVARAEEGDEADWWGHGISETGGRGAGPGQRATHERLQRGARAERAQRPSGMLGRERGRGAGLTRCGRSGLGRRRRKGRRWAAGKEEEVWADWAALLGWAGLVLGFWFSFSISIFLFQTLLKPN